MSELSYPGAGPRCPCGCPYLRGTVLVPLVLVASGHGRPSVEGPRVRDLPVESLVCEACGAETVTRDLPPVGIDLAAVLDELASGPATPRPRSGVPTCSCGDPRLTLSSVLTLVVHTAGASMMGDVASASAPLATGTLSCAGCARSWDVSCPDLPAQVNAAIGALTADLSSGHVGRSDWERD